MHQSGILLHISSLPGPEGIGSLGQSAYQFVDFLKASGMGIWQVLPVSPTGYGESPYQSFSTFAGNPLLIDLQTLRQEGLLKDADSYEDNHPLHIDYSSLIAYKTGMLQRVYQQSKGILQEELADFRTGQAKWLEDYALFYAIKMHFGGGSWMDWPDEAIRKRQPQSMEKYRQMLSEPIDYQVFVQYLFFKQWYRLKAYANARDIQLFGDMPIYVAMDSADCWANPDVFQLDVNRRPLLVAGVPPDYFSRDGQLWGNPLYNWKMLKKNDYAWWIDRLRAMGKLFDLIRVDHFIGFANYYAVHHGAATARYGAWRPGPGRNFFRVVKRELPHLKIIAEDLGAVNERVRKLLRYCGYPGMHVLSFAFSGRRDNPHLPQNCKKNAVYYTGTHDNDTLRGWWQQAGAGEKAQTRAVLGFTDDNMLNDAMIRTVLNSPANRAMLPMQDVLNFDGRARMNTPGTLGGNWQWRMPYESMSAELAAWLRQLNIQYARDNPHD
jgi:4-alpha-glucanotransferase